MYVIPHNILGFINCYHDCSPEFKKNPCVYITFDSDTTPYDIIVINGE